MPTKKIDEAWVAPKPCSHPEHDPPVFDAGTYEHTCPACGASQVFTVLDVRWLTDIYSKVWSSLDKIRDGMRRW